MVHEIGHGLGINHEQKRADAAQEYYGKGPHLQMFWENTGQWTSQYTPDIDSYIGSADDGGADPQVGYAAYDFAARGETDMGSGIDWLPLASICHIGLYYSIL